MSMYAAYSIFWLYRILNVYLFAHSTPNTYVMTVAHISKLRFSHFMFTVERFGISTVKLPRFYDSYLINNNERKKKKNTSTTSPLTHTYKITHIVLVNNDGTNG